MLKRVDCDAPIATILPVALAPLYVSVPLRRCLSVPEVCIWPPCAVTIAIRVCVTINDLQLVRIRDEESPPRGLRPRHSLVNGTETAEIETLGRSGYNIAICDINHIQSIKYVLQSKFNNQEAY